MAKSSILSDFYKHDNNEICLGDIVKDITISVPEDDQAIRTITFPFAIIMSQSCDLEQGMKLINTEVEAHKIDEDTTIRVRKYNPFLPNVILLPLFNDEELKDGKHLIDAYNIISMNWTGDLWKKIKSNQNPRFYYMQSISKDDVAIPASVIDFKIYFSYPYELLLKNYHKHYQISLNELFRESFSQRFTNYLNRIGLPEIEKTI